MARVFLTLGSSLGFLSVALGAFAAHGLKARLDEDSLKIFRLAVEYQFSHALALVLLGILLLRADVPLLRNSGFFFLAGIVVFSGSLYALSLTQIKILGAITPIGGTCFLIGWATMAYACWKHF